MSTSSNVEIMTRAALQNFTLAQIATLIRNTWPKVNYAAEPYLAAMATLTDMQSKFYADTARSIVSYFICNASSYRGDTAKLVKAELKRRLTVG